MSDTNAVAVVGIACRFPGARDVREYWEVLGAGRETIAHRSRAELLTQGAPRELLAHPGHVPAGGLIDDLDRFDAAFFQIPRGEAEVLDPQHRIFLELAWAGLEDAGCALDRYSGSVGVFGGTAMNTYASRLEASGATDALGVGGYRRMLSTTAVTRSATPRRASVVKSR